MAAGHVSSPVSAELCFILSCTGISGRTGDLLIGPYLAKCFMPISNPHEIRILCTEALIFNNSYF